MELTETSREVHSVKNKIVKVLLIHVGMFSVDFLV